MVGSVSKCKAHGAERQRSWALRFATLRERFEATRVVAFGSLTHRAWFSSWSDIDLAAWRIAAVQYYRAVAAVTGISPDFEVNLVVPEDCQPAIRQAIEREGIDV